MASEPDDDALTACAIEFLHHIRDSLMERDPSTLKIFVDCVADLLRSRVLVVVVLHA